MRSGGWPRVTSGRFGNRWAGVKSSAKSRVERMRRQVAWVKRLLRRLVKLPGMILVRGMPKVSARRKCPLRARRGWDRRVARRKERVAGGIAPGRLMPRRKMMHRVRVLPRGELRAEAPVTRRPKLRPERRRW